MSWRIISLALTDEEDVVAARQRARQIAAALGFDTQDQTRIATGVSEIARNAVNYGKNGKIDFALDGEARPQILSIAITDKGPGIASLTAILDGVYTSPTGMGQGIIGTKRLMDTLVIDTGLDGTTATLAKKRPRHLRALTQKDLAPIARALSQSASPLEELREQNRELMHNLETLAARESELQELANELESTNRGVVALHGELEATAQELRNASELKTRFLSNVSHELRTPLNSILALAQLVLDRTDGEINAEQEKQINFIRSAASGLIELVDDLLDIAKVEVGKIDVHPSRFTTFDLFGALRGLFKPLKTGDAVELIFEEPSGVPTLFTDEGKINQILRNFISNALKFTLSGSVTVSARYEEPDTILFAVKDTGIGIAKEDQERIFEEFEQVRGVHQTRIKGTGLGLTLSRRLAQLLHGAVALESTVGRGSTFFLKIPVDWQSDGPTVAPSAPVARRPGKRRILVADDDETFRYLLCKMIDAQKYDVIEAQDGDAALAAVGASHPDLVILDLKMPRRDGYSVLDEMMRDDATRHIPVIISSSMSLGEKDRGRLAAGRAILSKSTLSAEQLSTILIDALGDAPK